MDTLAATSQRRNLAILFSDLCDSTHISGQLEPEQFAALLEAMRAIYDSVIERHGGLIVRIDGDGLLCAFGYPEALDDAARRATEAALDLHRAIMQLDASNTFPGASIRLHSGVHAGTVLVREGDMVRGRIEILGDATNLAARLCDHASADQVVVSLESLGADRNFFESQAELAVPIKGRKAAVPALLVVGRAKVGTRFDARNHYGTAPFIGREQQFGQLREAIAKASSGALQRAVVWGQPGIGKTRLLGKVLDEAVRAGFTVGRGYCEAYLGTRPLQPFEQIARSIWPESPPPVDQLPARLLDWAHENEQHPLVLAIDDWQWVDDASRALLEDMIAARPSYLLVLLVSRPEGVEPGGDDTDLKIELGPLTPKESEQAIAGLLRTADPFRIERIRDLAGGSPLYIEELCQVPAAGSVANLGGSGGDTGAWLDALVQKRYLALPERQAELVRTASVVGHMIPLDLFSAVAMIDLADPVLGELSARDFLHMGEVEGTLRFKHALTRDAVYRLIGLDERKRIHAAVASQLEAMASRDGDTDYLESLAYHYASCGNVEQSIKFAIRAGDRAMSLAALDRAQAHYGAALELSERSETGRGDDQWLYKLIHKYGLAAANDPSIEQISVLERAEASARRNRLRDSATLAAYWNGSILYGLGDGKGSIAKLRSALESARDLHHPELIDQINASLGESFLITCQYDLAEPIVCSAIEALRKTPTKGPPTGLVYLLGCQAMYLADTGQFESSMVMFGEAFTLLGETELMVRSSLFTKMAGALCWREDYRAAYDVSSRALELSLRTRERFNNNISNALSAYAEWKLTKSRDAIFRLEASAKWFQSGASVHCASLNYGWLCDVLGEVGDKQAVRHYAAHAFALARQGDLLGLPMAARALARLAAKEGRLERATRFLKVAYRAGERRKSQHELAQTRFEQAVLLETPDAEQLLDAASEAAIRMGLAELTSKLDKVRSEPLTSP